MGFAPHGGKARHRWHDGHGGNEEDDNLWNILRLGCVTWWRKNCWWEQARNQHGQVDSGRDHGIKQLSVTSNKLQTKSILWCWCLTDDLLGGIGLDLFGNYMELLSFYHCFWPDNYPAVIRRWFSEITDMPSLTTAEIRWVRKSGFRRNLAPRLDTLLSNTKSSPCAWAIGWIFYDWDSP